MHLVSLRKSGVTVVVYLCTMKLLNKCTDQFEGLLCYFLRDPICGSINQIVKYRHVRVEWTLVFIQIV
jgi:hypothetical protein